MTLLLPDVSTATLVVVGVVALNVVTFALWGVDKWKASRGKWRVPEKILLQLAFVGGWPAAWIGAHHFRHKSSKLLFRRKLMVATLLNLAVVAGLIWATR